MGDYGDFQGHLAALVSLAQAFLEENKDVKDSHVRKIKAAADYFLPGGIEGMKKRTAEAIKTLFERDLL